MPKGPRGEKRRGALRLQAWFFPNPRGVTGLRSLSGLLGERPSVADGTTSI